ncbi:hypothetical protein AB0N09_42860 [Streptomyces erythrochromogenes]|uniref:hypothetical protein n=1 Tax=Streptomyces erythrochromogenes TaxID=285574 RepID=UPI0034228BDE
MAEPIPEPSWDDTPLWWDPAWTHEGHPVLDDVWQAFEDHLAALAPADGTDTTDEGGADQDRLSESDRVAAALDATWAALDQLDTGHDPEETRPWLAQTLLDSALPHTTSPQPVLDALTHIAVSPHGADTRYPTETALTDTGRPWQNGPQTTHPHLIHSQPLDPRYPGGLSLPTPTRNAPTPPINTPRPPATATTAALPSDMVTHLGRQQSVLAVIRYTGIADPAEIAQATGLTISDAYQTLRDLAENLGVPTTRTSRYDGIVAALRDRVRPGGDRSHIYIHVPQPEPEPRTILFTAAQTRVLSAIKNTDTTDPERIPASAGMSTSSANATLRRLAHDLRMPITYDDDRIVRELHTRLRPGGDLSHLPLPWHPPQPVAPRLTDPQTRVLSAIKNTDTTDPERLADHACVTHARVHSILGCLVRKLGVPNSYDHVQTVNELRNRLRPDGSLSHLHLPEPARHTTVFNVTPKRQATTEPENPDHTKRRRTDEHA